VLAAAYYHSPELPWTMPEEEEQRFRKILKRVLLLLLLLALLMPFLPLPDIARERVEEIPPRLAKLILERQQPPAPPPKPEQPEFKKPEPKAETKKVEPTKKIEAARKKAESSGILALKDELAGLRDNDVSAKLDSNVRNTGAQKSGPASNPSLISSLAGKDSGGIRNTGSGKDTGGGGLGTRGTTQVSSPVGSGDGRGGSVRKGGGGSASRSLEEIRLVFERNKGSIYSIYNRALREDPALQGKIVLKLTISPSGQVTGLQLVSSELRAPELERKLLARIKLFDFGAKAVNEMVVTYPIDFVPS
jgi:protein TonB